MTGIKCLNCPEYDRCRDSLASWIFFLIGLIATIAIRIVNVLFDIHPLYGKAAWYVGVTGFLVFFLYKFRVDRERADLIAKLGLSEKINLMRPMEEADYRAISSLLCALSSRKDRINYFFIFFSSALVLFVAVYFDLLPLLAGSR